MKNYLEYKGYTGTVEFSAEDNCLFGKNMKLNELASKALFYLVENEKTVLEKI